MRYTQPSVADLQAQGVDATSAAFLISNLRPLPPAGGPSISASGISTHILYTERCASDSYPPKFYTCQYAERSDPLTYATASIQPTAAASAVVADISVTAGTATVVLKAPNGMILRQVTLSAGQTGGVGYYDPTAAAGIYSVTISGNAPGSADSGGKVIGQKTYTDATWSGALSW